MMPGETSRSLRPGPAEALEWACYFGTVSVALWVTRVLDVPTILIGLPPLFFMAYVIYKSGRARRAREAEEAAEISDASRRAQRCEVTLGLLERLADPPISPRARLALERLAAGIGTLLLRYQRYLDDGAIRSALEAEDMILRAELGEDHEIKARLAAMGAHIRGIRAGILDVSHPRLRAARERV